MAHGAAQRRGQRRRAAVVALGALIVAACGSTSSSTSGPEAAPKMALSGIKHIVVIYQENWSFDSLYGKFPGANGWSQAGTISQVDSNGAPLTSLPQPYLDTGSPPAKPPVVDPKIPAGLPVAGYDLSKYVPPTGKTGDLVHRYYQEQVQIDGGKNDRFVSGSDNPGLVLSYYDGTPMPEGQLAQQNVLADNFFHSAFGGSFLNHQWLICACTPKWDTSQAPIPDAKVAKLDASGKLMSDGYISPDGHVINTAYTVNSPHPKSFDAPDQKGFLVPELTDPTIGDRLNDKGVSWAWYSGGWNNALAGSADANFQFHHQPFAFYKNYADGTDLRKQHLKDEFDFIGDIRKGTLPSVAFIKPLGDDNEHPGYANEAEGQAHVLGLVSAIETNPAYKDNTAIIITYDENGGRYDHVAPPKGDVWGPGTRVPAVIVAPFAKHGVVDHTQYETVSILRLIEKRFDVQPLSDRDAKANDLTAAFDLAS